MNEEVTQKDDRPLLVTIRCMAYNHVAYIRQCLEGFVMQKTNFRFEAIIHDDASTDGTADIIREYEKKYPDIIKPIYQVENQYSKHDGTIRRALDSKSRGKYIALCEGDDFWIDPLKLQKQVDYMQAHPNCTMTCNRTKWFSQKQNKEVCEQYCRKGSGLLKVEDVIKRSGLYIPTCSMVICRDVLDNFPDFCSQCLVGDYPLQILCAVKGDVFYFDDCMSIYRVDNCNSWMGTQNFGTLSEKRKKVIISIINMLRGFATLDPNLLDVVSSTIANEINGNIPYWKASSKDINRYLESFKNEIRNYDWRWKVDMIIRKAKIPGLRRLYTPIFLSNYQVLKKRI